MRHIKSFNRFHAEKLFLEKKREEISNESESTKEWKKIHENKDVGWNELEGNDKLFDKFIKRITIQKS